MSGFWYSTAIAATAGVLLSLSSTEFSSARFSPTLAIQGVDSQLTSQKTEPNAKQSVDQQTFDRAMELAHHAVAAYQAASQEKDVTHALAFTQRERMLWQATIQTLARIPASSDLYKRATAKQTQYVQLLGNAERKLSVEKAEFFAPILKNTGVNAANVHITLCQLDVDTSPSYAAKSTKSSSTDLVESDLCRQHQGDVQMASPASLIKLPIAIALMDKSNTEAIDLDSKLYIDPANFTENAEGASVEVDKEYTLTQVMTRMINQSNNIATNQLIDYVGREQIAQTLANRGYTDTLVDHKLAGDRILPPNPGTQSNQSTTNDLTIMMADTYGLKNPGDEALLRALMSQTDRELGHQALAEAKTATKAEVAWLGEKTGQNNRVIGTTLAMTINGNRYALTVAIDHSADPAAIRSIIKGTVSQLINQGALVEASGR